jgi:hypothetical protein
MNVNQINPFDEIGEDDIVIDADEMRTLMV